MGNTLYFCMRRTQYAKNMKVNPTKFELAEPPPVDDSIKDEMVALGLIDALTAAMSTEGKFARGRALKTARNDLIAQLNDGIEDEETLASRVKQAKYAWDKTLSSLMRSGSQRW